MGDSNDKFLYFLVGASIGSLFGILFAPKSGQETRDELIRRAQESGDYLNDKVDEAKNLVETESRRVGHEVTSLVDRSKEEAETLIEKGKDVVQQQKKQFSAAFEAGKEAYFNESEAD